MRKAVGVDCSLDASVSMMDSNFFWNQIKKVGYSKRARKERK